MYQNDPFIGILQELGAPPASAPAGKRSVIGVANDDALVEAANEVAKTPPASTGDSYLSHLVAAHATQLADERARREAAEKDIHRNRGWMGWAFAGGLALLVVYLLARRK